MADGSRSSWTPGRGRGTRPAAGSGASVGPVAPSHRFFPASPLCSSNARTSSPASRKGRRRCSLDAIRRARSSSSSARAGSLSRRDCSASRINPSTWVASGAWAIECSDGLPGA